MCGIIGVTGEADAVPLLLGALHQLEYRGYDSAGVAMVVDGEIWRARAAGGTESVAALAELTQDAPTGHAAAIGHTRWATHGSPTRRERPPPRSLHRTYRPHPQRDHREPRRGCGRSSSPAGTP